MKILGLEREASEVIHEAAPGALRPQNQAGLRRGIVMYLAGMAPEIRLQRARG